MTMERVGVQAIVEGAGQYLNDAQRINTATFGMAQSAKSAEDSFNVFARSQEAARANLRQSGAIMRETGTQALFLGAALAAPGALAVKFAADFESAFAGVRKTVDATEVEFGALRAGILDLTSELPTSASNLADIAAAAGQLGVAKGDILDFTRVTAQLAETTDLSTEAAATGLARFANVLQLPQDAVERTAAALVDLGNKSAATESEILDLSQRLAAAGKTIGLSADQVLAFGTALRSVGVESEAGGTAFSRVFIEIAKAVETGGANLDRFAQVAGVSGTQFAQAFRQDAASAVVDFVEGLGRLQASGRGTFGVLEELSLNDARLTRALLSAASAGDLFRDSLTTGATAFRQNSALTTEFARRIETTGAQFRLFVNELQRFGIETGTALLPAARAIIGVLRDVVGAFNAIPAPVRAVIAGISILGGGLVLAIGTLGIFAGSVLSIAGALPGLTAALGGTTTALGLLRTASLAFLATPVGPVLLAIAAAAGVAFVAYKLLTRETEEERRVHDELKASTEGVSKALRDAAAAERELAEARRESKAEEDDDKGKTAAEAETAANKRLAESVGKIAEARRAQADVLSRQRAALTAGRAGEPVAAVAGGPTDAGAALLARAQALQAEGGGRGFRREDVQAASRANIDFAKSILGITEETARVDPLLLRFIESLSANERTLLKNEAAARNVVSAGGELARAISNEDEVLGSARGTADAHTIALRSMADALAEIDRASRAAAGGVSEASIKIAEQVAVTTTNAAAVRDLAVALEGLAKRGGAERAEFERLFPAEEEGAGARGEVPRPTGLAAVKALQESSRGLASLNAARAAAAAAAARGGGPSIAERRTSALEATEKRQREEQASALIRERVGLKPGEKGLSTVQAEQRRLDAAFSAITDELAALGFEVPEEFRDMFDRIQTETEEGTKRSGNKIGGLLGFLVARRFNAGLDPTAGLISQPAAVTASLTRGTPREAGVVIDNVNIGPGTTTGDIQQGMGVAFRSAFGSV